ncbi:hypothetical protein V6N13_080299 [Hibiscus sabdariffa]
MYEVKLWHVPLESYSQKGLGCLASALGKPLYTDRATAWKQQLEFAKVFVDMATTFVLPDSISVEVGDDRFVDVGVELAWSPPRCCSCAIFGHSEKKYPKKASTPTGMESIPIVEKVPTDHVPVVDSLVDSEVVLASEASDNIVVVDTGFNDIVVAAEVAGDVACLDMRNDSDDLQNSTGMVLLWLPLLLSFLFLTMLKVMNSHLNMDFGSGWLEVGGVEKSCAQFVNEGDKNSTYFFRKVTVRQKANTILSIKDSQGRQLVSFEDISQQFVKFFYESLGTMDLNVALVPDELLKEIVALHYLLRCNLVWLSLFLGRKSRGLSLL